MRVKQSPSMIVDGSKRCSACGKVKPRRAFYPNNHPRSKCGLQSHCKNCNRILRQLARRGES